MSDHRPVVFLGPSLPLAEARRILDADYRRPVRRGDIDPLLDAPPAAIAIVDGEFFQSLAISPKEVLRAIDRGVPVWGASSLGALRAAELHPFGMVGVGTVFEWYRSGRIAADDEVAVTFAPDSGAPVSEAMINIRIALRRAAEAGVIGPATARNLVRAAKSMYFPERTWPNLWRKASSSLSRREHAALCRYLEKTRPDIKAEDARLLLHSVGQALSPANARDPVR